MGTKFEITKFEVLENSNEMLKGGFSTAYAEMQFGGKGGGLEVNFTKGCSCTNTCNLVKGCGCTETTTVE